MRYINKGLSILLTILETLDLRVPKSYRRCCKYNRYIDSHIPMLLQVFVAIKFNRSVLRYYELARGL